MARSMFDSTNPGSCPKSPIDGNSGGILIAYYPYAFSSPTKSSFPAGTLFVTIDQSTSASHPDCDVLDVEPGCASPSQVTSWLQRHKAATGKQGTVYCNTSTKSSIPNSEPYYWWAAEWTNNPATHPSGATACQYKSTSGYDASSVFDASWPHGTPTPPKPAGDFHCSGPIPGNWKGKGVLTGKDKTGTTWYTATVDGREWTGTAQTEPGTVYATATVKSNQNLEVIAAYYGVSVVDLAHANGLGTGSGLRTGQVLKVPNATNEYTITVAPPGWWKTGGTLVFGANGTDNNRWHTSSSDGHNWRTPIRT